MRVIIMRHGEARFAGADRILSEHGRQEARLTGMQLVTRYRIDRIVASGKSRARQTAEEVRSLIRAEKVPEIETDNALLPYGDGEMLMDCLMSTCDEDETVLLVSHIPQVMTLAETLCGGQQVLPVFVTAAALVAERQRGGRFKAVAMLTPNAETSF